MSNMQEDLEVLGENLERLKIENGLLRAASEEQRELNGDLRKELTFRLLMRKALEEWVGCFAEISTSPRYGTKANRASPRLNETYNLTIDLLAKLEE